MNDEQGRTVTASMTGDVPSNYMLDNFVAHKLSLLTECGAPEFAYVDNWLSAFILNSVFIAQLPPKQRAYAFNFLRRAQGALSSYRLARLELIDYLQSPRGVLSPYFRALLHFEVCISQSYQAFELLATASGLDVFDKDDGSKEERLYRLYIQSKDMGGMIQGGKIPTEATAAIWITNHGIECNGTSLSFEELVSLLEWIAKMADRISKLEFGNGG